VRLGISWLTNAVVLLVVDLLLTGVTTSSAGALLLAAAVFGVLNTVALLTFGIAWFFVSLFMLLLTHWIVSGFDIHGFWTLVAATLIVWIVNLVLDFVPGPWQVAGRRGRRNRRVRGE
jgi:putative membrane protein